MLVDKVYEAYGEAAPPEDGDKTWSCLLMVSLQGCRSPFNCIMMATKRQRRQQQA